MKAKSHSSAWKLACWMILAFAIYLYQVGAVVAAWSFGAFAVLMFVVDFKVSMMEADTVAASSDPADALRKLCHGAILAVWLIIAGQVIMKWVQTEVPNKVAPSFCFICGTYPS